MTNLNEAAKQRFAAYDDQNWRRLMLTCAKVSIGNRKNLPVSVPDDVSCPPPENF